MTRCKRTALRRLWSWVLVLALLAGLVPGFPLTLPAQAADSYLDPYLNKMVDWGFMRGDIEGNLNPNGSITRAEFVTIINRAFGYDQGGSTPFSDVPSTAWYAEDVGIAYNEGYITGTSDTTFSPLSTITREEAAVILTRNLMMQADTGEDISFTDSRDFGEWSRGYISTASRYQLLNGYPDGSFRPQNQLSRGEAAILIVNAIGTPIQTEGSQSLGYVYGNVTITASGATLRDTVVAGNLYITAGVDLGHVTLENVTVLGEIVISGGGVSEGGEDSVVLRNVTTPTLIVDNLRNQQVSIRVSGDGTVQNTSVRTETYIEDTAPSGCGLLRIALEGETEIGLKLAGNIKEVVNYTPGSALSLERGTAEKITVDEKATSSTLEIVSGAVADEVNLDVGTTVTGSGDINKLVVNSNGSTVSMLPDQIVIRPGNTANIAGEEMDSNAAAESSADPRMLAGYPKIADLAPTSATAQFAANKKGTLYWAITAVTDGSVGADDLINPSSYSPKVVKSGTVSLTGSGQVGSAKISGLTSDGSYYLSTVFVDARDERSPLKVISFTTPDDTKPDFASGYPYMSKITNISGQVTAMATKTCRLYWAVLPKGASAPTGDDFKSNAVTGNLGYGTMDVTKNTEYTFEANNVPLEELASYDLYLWLTDVDGGQSSAVKKLSFTTVDGTPPVFNTEPTINKVDKTSVGLYANLNEAGTLYWVVVNQGEEYPKPLAGQSGAVDLASDTAKLQVMAGMNALKSGKVSMTENKDVSFTVSGLDPEKAYDLYYVAQDKAGNYSATVKKITIHTLDPNAPTVTQEFTKYNGTDTTTPLPNTDIRLVFSEAVQDAATNTAYVDLYQAVTQAAEGAAKEAARETMANVLRNSIKLYVDTGNGRPEVVPEATSTTNKATDQWIIDYRYAEITLEEGKTVVTFPTKSAVASSGLSLESGATYYFEIEAGTIADTSGTKNIMGKTTLDPFKTVFAIVSLSNPNITNLGIYTPDDPEDEDDVKEAQTKNRVDVSWTLSPMTTESTSDSIDWDMVIWSDTSAVFELYYRNTETGTGAQPDWKLLGTQTITVPDGTERVGVSLTRHFLDPSNAPEFNQLNTLLESAEYEYAIHFTQIGSLTDPDTWSQRVNVTINVLAGSTNDLQTLANNLTVDNYNSMVPSSITNIGQPAEFKLIKQFSDQTPPVFASGHPTFDAGSSAVNMYLMLDRPGTLYYVVAPLGTIPTTGKDADKKDCNFSDGSNPGEGYDKLPEEGDYPDGTTFDYLQEIATPARLDIVNASTTYAANPRIKYGSTTLGPSEIEQLVEGLEPTTKYTVYFVIQGMSNQTYSDVYAYRFETSDVDIPYITLEAPNPDVSFTTSEDAKLDYALFAPNQLPDVFDEEMLDDNLDSSFTNADAPKNGDGSVMTVLDAMLNTYEKATGKSYFDYYADQDLKNEVQEIIQRRITGGGSPVATGKLETDKEVSQSVDFTSAMQSEENATYFYCLATAQNALGSAYSFKAVDNVHIPDREPPYLVFVGRTLDLAKCDPEKNKYTGTLTLQFNEPIYYMDYQAGSTNGDPKTLRPVYQIPYGNEPNTTGINTGHISVIDAAGKPTGFTVDSWLKSPTRTFTIQFTDIGDGATFTLSNIGVLSDAAMNATKEAFTLQFKVGNGGVEGFLNTAYFEVISGDYRPTTGN